MPAGASLRFFAESDESMVEHEREIIRGVFIIVSNVVMQMLDSLVVFTLLYQCNDSEMGSHCCDANS